MKYIFKYILLGLIFLPLTLQAETYRWKDTKGKVHYSNSFPASDSQLGHDVLNNSGFKKKTVLSAKKAREVKLTEIKREKQKAIDSEKLKRKRIEDAEDSRLLYIFNNETELTESYNAKLRLAQLTIDLLKARHKVQSDKLTELERRHEKAVLVLQKNALEKQIIDVLDNLKIYQQAITENHVEKDRVKKDYKNTLSRYKRLLAAKAKKVTK